MSGWIELTTIVTEELIDPVSDALRPFAEGESVVVEQLGDPHNLAPTAMLPEVRLKIYFPAAQDSPAHRQTLEDVVTSFGCPLPQFKLLQDVDWTTAWRDYYQPLHVGDRFLIQPSWLPLETTEPAASAKQIVLWLDPGMAFGTGQHATTQLCLQALAQVLQPGDAVLDVGTGSGILAIAAAKLGAQLPIVALDVDENADTAVSENATLNQLDGQIEMHIGSLKDINLPQQAWDIVIANILAAILHPLIQDEALLKYARPGGHYIFSGIIHEQEADFRHQLNAAGVTVQAVLYQEDWLAIIAQAPQ